MFTPPIISKTLAVTTLTAILSLVTAPAQAVLITGVTASSSGFGNLGLDINNTVNGSGLLPEGVPSLTGDHARSSFRDSWFGAGTTGNINFNLGGLYDLNGFSFWNYFGSRGINEVNILTSTDGTNFTVLTGAPTQFAFVPDAGSFPPEQFTFAATQAAFVRFTVLSNYGNSLTGISEVQFDGTPTAVPFEFSPVSGLVVLGLGFGLSKLRKKAVIK